LRDIVPDATARRASGTVVGVPTEAREVRPRPAEMRALVTGKEHPRSAQHLAVSIFSVCRFGNKG